jgi:hypothetical protein
MKKAATSFPLKQVCFYMQRLTAFITTVRTLRKLFWYSQSAFSRIQTGVTVRINLILYSHIMPPIWNQRVRQHAVIIWRGTPGNGVPNVIRVAQRTSITDEETTAKSVPVVRLLQNDHWQHGVADCLSRAYLRRKLHFDIRLVWSRKQISNDAYRRPIRADDPFSCFTPKNCLQKLKVSADFFNFAWMEIFNCRPIARSNYARSLHLVCAWKS